MIKYFKSLNSGIKRSLIIGTFLGASIIGVLFALDDSYFYWEDFFISSVVIGIPVYWVIVFAGLWVYQGFKKNQILDTKPIIIESKSKEEILEQLETLQVDLNNYLQNWRKTGGGTRGHAIGSMFEGIKKKTDFFKKMC